VRVPAAEPPTSAPLGESPATFGIVAQVTSPLPKRRQVVGVWLGLPLITLGIYSLVWWHKINRETLFNPRTRVTPFVSLIAVTLGALLVVPPFVSIYRTGQRIAEAQRAAGLTPTCTPVRGLLRSFVFGLHSLYYQAEMNKVPDAYPGIAANQPVPVRGR
jgi:hypothetical protein